MNSYLFNIVQSALSEDLGSAGDITSHALIDPSQRSRAKIISRQKGVIAGTDYFREVFLEVDKETAVKLFKADGEPVLPDEIIAQVEGRTASLLSAERTALNFLGHLSGIATKTKILVDKISGTNVKLLDTRKTIPGLRVPEKQAVRAGGGFNHRLGLYDMILIKENHIASAGGIIKALEKAHSYNQRVGGRLEIEIEVKNLSELAKALTGSPHRIMLDNFTPEEVKKAVEFVKGKIPLEVSGGVNEDNIRTLAEAGPDYISVGAITISAPVLDLSMLIEGV